MKKMADTCAKHGSHHDNCRPKKKIIHPITTANIVLMVFDLVFDSIISEKYGCRLKVPCVESDAD